MPEHEEFPMSRPARRRRAPSAAPASQQPPSRGPAPKALESFLHHLGRTGSVTFAAAHAGVERRTLYRLRARDEAFAGHWDEALQLGIDRLQDDAMRRALDGTERPVFRNGKQVGSVVQYDNRLLQFLLRAHRPEIYADRGKAAAASLPFDLVKRMAEAEKRAEAHRKEQKARERKATPKKKSDGGR